MPERHCVLAVSEQQNKHDPSPSRVVETRRQKAETEIGTLQRQMHSGPEMQQGLSAHAPAHQQT
eukprot:2959555-Rhodomonas_salina.1